MPLALRNRLPAARAGRMGRAGFTLVELLVVVAIMALLMALVLPVLQNAMAGAKTAQCISNQRQIGQGLAAYMTAHDEFLPACWYERGYGAPDDTYWVDRVLPYLGGEGLSKGRRHPLHAHRRSDAYPVLKCPAVENHHYIADVGMNPFVSGLYRSNRLSLVPSPARTVMICDARHPSWWAPGGLEYGAWYLRTWEFVGAGLSSAEPADRHFGHQIVLLFCDGHVEALPGSVMMEQRDSLFGVNYFGQQ